MDRFDSSRDRGQPLTTSIGVGRVIKGIHFLDFLHFGVFGARRCNVYGGADVDQPGWDEGVLQMSLGEKAILTIDPWVSFLSFPLTGSDRQIC